MTDPWDPMVSPQARRALDSEELNRWLDGEWYDVTYDEEGRLTSLRGVEPTELW